jgi:hypothetical protein
MLGLRCLGAFKIISMSTAIVRTFTPDGFVVATDGLAGMSDDGRVTGTQDPKVFRFGDADDLAFSFAGSVQLGYMGRVRFDFIQTFEAAVNIHSPDRSNNIMDYASLLATGAQRQLEAKRRSGAIRFTETSNERDPAGNFIIAGVFIDGYFKGVPARANLIFYHRGQVPYVQTAPEGFSSQPIVYGPDEVTKRFESDPGFSKYKTEPSLSLHSSASLSKEIHLAKCIIEAHGSPEARAIDPICKYIGGRTHIATVTPGEGFKWVDGFEPINPSFPTVP